MTTELLAECHRAARDDGLAAGLSLLWSKLLPGVLPCGPAGTAIVPTDLGTTAELVYVPVRTALSHGFTSGSRNFGGGAIRSVLRVVHGAEEERSEAPTQATAKAIAGSTTEAGRPAGEPPRPASQVLQRAGEIQQPPGEDRHPVGDVGQRAGEVGHPVGEVGQPLGGVRQPLGGVGQLAGGVGRPVGEVGRLTTLDSFDLPGGRVDVLRWSTRDLPDEATREVPGGSTGDIPREPVRDVPGGSARHAPRGSVLEVPGGSARDVPGGSVRSAVGRDGVDGDVRAAWVTWTLGLVWVRLGLSEGLRDSCVQYLRGRRSGESTLLQQQLVKGALADALAEQLEIRAVLTGLGPGDVDAGPGPGDADARLGPEDVDTGLGPEDVDTGLGPGDVVAGLGPGDVVAGLGPGDVVAGLGPEDVDTGLGPGGVDVTPLLVDGLHGQITRVDRALLRLLGATSMLVGGPGEVAYVSELIADAYRADGER